MPRQASPSWCGRSTAPTSSSVSERPAAQCGRARPGPGRRRGDLCACSDGAFRRPRRGARCRCHHELCGSDPHRLAQALLARAGRATILTPHEGEFSRFFWALDEANESGIEARKGASGGRDLTGAVVLLKGGDTVVAAPDGRASIAANAPAYPRHRWRGRCADRDSGGPVGPGHAGLRGGVGRRLAPWRSRGGGRSRPDLGGLCRRRCRACIARCWPDARRRVAGDRIALQAIVQRLFF